MDAAIIASLLVLLAPAVFSALRTAVAILAPATDPALGAAFVLWAAVSVSYYTLADGILGATPGKALLGLRLRTSRGRTPGPGAAFKRTVAGILDLALLTPLILPLLTSSGRTLGDYISDTVVLPVEHLPSSTGYRGPNRSGGGWWGRGARGMGREIDRRRIQVGLEAERTALDTLRPLQALGYEIFTNIEHPAFGDIDVLVIGPGGAFCIEVKGHSGTVTEESFSGSLLRDGRPFEKDFRAQVARQQAFLVSYLFKGAKNPPVFAVICFTRASLRPGHQGSYPHGVISLSDLRPAIQSAPELLSPGRIRKASARISQFVDKGSRSRNGNKYRRGAA